MIQVLLCIPHPSPSPPIRSLFLFSCPIETNTYRKHKTFVNALVWMVPKKNYNKLPCNKNSLLLCYYLYYHLIGKIDYIEKTKALNSNTFFRQVISVNAYTLPFVARLGYMTSWATLSKGMHVLRSAVKSCKGNLFTTHGHLCLFCDNLLSRVCRELEEYDFRKKKVNLSSVVKRRRQITLLNIYCG